MLTVYGLGSVKNVVLMWHWTAVSTGFLGFMDPMQDTHTDSKGLTMTVSAERIEELTCYSDDALAAMCGVDGYYDWTCSGEYLFATLEEVEAVHTHRAEQFTKWVDSLADDDREAMVESGELPAEYSKKLTLAKPYLRPVLIARDKSGNAVKVGDKVVSFRGEPATLVSLDRPADEGRSGKVTVKWDGFDGGHCEGFEGQYYDVVFDLSVTSV